MTRASFCERENHALKLVQKFTFHRSIFLELHGITTSFAMNMLCLKIIYDATVGLYYLSPVTIPDLEVLVPLCQNQGCKLKRTQLFRRT